MRVEPFNRAKGISPITTNSKVGVMYLITKVLLEKSNNPLIREYMDDDKLFHLVRSKLYYSYTNTVNKINARTTSLDIAWKVIPKIRLDGYSLYLAKFKTPPVKDYDDGDGVFVARTFDFAKAVVESLGRPTSLYIESDMTESAEELNDLVNWIKNQGMVSWTNPNPPHLVNDPANTELMVVTFAPNNRNVTVDATDTV